MEESEIYFLAWAYADMMKIETRQRAVELAGEGDLYEQVALDRWHEWEEKHDQIVKAMIVKGYI